MTELKDKVKENHSDGFFEFSFPKKEQSLSIIEYAEKQLKTFDVQPFGSVDSLLLSQVAYMHLDVAVPGVEYDGEAVRIADLYKAEYFDSIFDDVRDAKREDRDALLLRCALAGVGVRRVVCASDLRAGLHLLFTVRVW